MPEGNPMNFDRVIGGSDDDQRKAMEEYEHRANYFGSYDFSKYEVEKTSRFNEMAQKTDIAVSRMASRYGGAREEVPGGKIRLISSAKLGSKGEFGGGFHNPLHGYIVVEKAAYDPVMQQTLAHEFFHQKAYRSAQIVSSSGFLGRLFGIKPKHTLYRQGLSIVERSGSKEALLAGEGRTYFAYLEEAIVAEMNRRFFKMHVKTDPRYRQDVRDTELLKDELKRIISGLSPGDVDHVFFHRLFRDMLLVGNAGSILDGIKDNDNDEYRLGFIIGSLDTAKEERRLVILEREEEREQMYALFADILKHSKHGEFSSMEDVFDAFAQANFSGNLLPLARKVEAVLGRGSFRKIGEDFSRNKSSNFIDV